MDSLSVGILAGGAGRRVGGRDKGWIEVGGRPQVMHVLDALGWRAGPLLVSANRNQARYAGLGLEVIEDRWPAHPGPLAGVASLLAAASTRWLLTVPVDAAILPADLVDRLREHRRTDGVAVACDAEATQPMFALYDCALAQAAVEAFDAGARSVRDWQRSLPLREVHFARIRFGNRNLASSFDPT